jgi:hypothetical protein
MISSEHAHLLISKYRSEQTLLRLTFILRDLSVNIRLTARALASEEGPRELTFVAENGDHCLVVLDGCSFDYGDPREVSDPDIRAKAEAKFAGSLAVLFRSGERLYIMELR